MIRHIIEHFKIPHPLDRGKGDIAVSEPRKLGKKCFDVWLDNKKTKGPAELPQVLRVLVSPDKVALPQDLDRVLRFEQNAKIQDEHSWNIVKLKIFLRFAAACGIGYFIFWTIFNFPWFWVPATLILENILGDVLTKIFQGVVIAFIPGLSFIKNFIGAKRWPSANFRARYTEIYPQFGGASRKYFVKEVTKCLRNIKKEALSEGTNLELTPLENLLEEILTKYEVDVNFAKSWNERFEKILEDLSQSAREVLFLAGAVIKLDQLRSDLLYHYLEGFKIVPLKVATLEKNPQDFFPVLSLGFDPSLSFLAEGFIQKSRNLNDFLRITDSIREEIYRAFGSLEEAETRDERVRLLGTIEEGFGSLRNIAGNYHFGDNPRIPQEKGVNLSDLYDRLYFLFGRAKLDILDQKRAVRGVIFKRLSVKTNRAQASRVKRLKFEVERLLCQGVEHKKVYEKVAHGVSFWGKNWQRSLLFSGVVLFIFATLLSFKVLGPDQVLSTQYLRVGVKEQATQKVPLFSRGIKIYHFGQGLPIIPGKELFWQLPVPLVYSHTVDFNQEQKFQAYMIFSGATDTLYKKGLKLLAGPYGGFFEIVELDFDFRIKDKDAWMKYDYDGKGTKRLRRDITSVVDQQWRAEIFDFREGPLVRYDDKEEMEKAFSDSYFKKLWKQGAMEQILKSQIFKNPMLTYQYGTSREMLAPGMDQVLRSLEAEIAQIKYGNLSKQEKEKKIAEIEKMKKKVEEIKEKILEMIKEEYDALRKDPEKFKKYLSDLENLAELKKESPMVWSTVQQLILHSYVSEKFIKIMKGEFGPEKKQELLDMLVEKIQENSYFNSLIEIKGVRAKATFMDSHGYRSLVGKITKEVI